MSIIADLRELGSIDGTIKDYDGERDERLDEIDVLTHRWGRPNGVTVEVVDSTFEDLGRWSNYETKVYKITEGDEVAYFEFGKEMPATESQEGMDCGYHFYEVVPQEIKVVKYVEKN